MTRILITGSRTWTDRVSVARPIMRLISELCPMLLDENGNPDRRDTSGLVIVHGAAKGADLLAAEWAEGCTPPIRTESHPVTRADWEEFGRGAGYRRNARMVELGADACAAFINPCRDVNCKIVRVHGTHGASHTADLAESVGIYTVRTKTFKDPANDGAA